MSLRGDGVLTISNLATGSLTSASGVITSSGSDSRLKNNIQPIVNYGLDQVMQLEPVTFSYKSDENNTTRIGFIAQEIQKIIPELVYGIEGDLSKNENLAIYYENLTAILTKAIQEQQQQIQLLRQEIELLKNK